MHSDEQDKAVRKLLMATLPGSPKTSREAYEMVKGNAASDTEWAKHGGACERNWAECVELYRIVTEVEATLNAAYERYEERYKEL